MADLGQALVELVAPKLGGVIRDQVVWMGLDHLPKLLLRQVIGGHGCFYMFGPLSRGFGRGTKGRTLLSTTLFSSVMDFGSWLLSLIL